MADLNDSLLAGIKKDFPHLSYAVDKRSYGCQITFPIKPNSDYGFRACLYEDETDIEINARLSEKWDKDLPEDYYFWYMPFESQDFKNDDELRDAFSKALRLLLTHETRIIQKKTFFFWKFICEYKHEGSWIHLDSIRAFRFSNFHVPHAGNKERFFFAKPSM